MITKRKPWPKRQQSHAAPSMDAWVAGMTEAQLERWKQHRARMLSEIDPDQSAREPGWQASTPEQVRELFERLTAEQPIIEAGYPQRAMPGGGK